MADMNLLKYPLMRADWLDNISAHIDKGSREWVVDRAKDAAQELRNCAATIEKLTAERDAALAAQREAEGKVAVLREALEYAKPKVRDWCNFQESDRTFFEGTMAPIEAALADTASLAAAHDDAVIERCARQIECGCANRDKVAALKHKNSGERWLLCPQENCMAIDAAAIRALKSEEKIDE